MREWQHQKGDNPMTLAELRNQYRPYNSMPAFDEGFAAYEQGTVTDCWYGRGSRCAQAWDRGAECAMRWQRYNVNIEALKRTDW